MTQFCMANVHLLLHSLRNEQDIQHRILYCWPAEYEHRRRYYCDVNYLIRIQIRHSIHFAIYMCRMCSSACRYGTNYCNVLNVMNVTTIYDTCLWMPHHRLASDRVLCTHTHSSSFICVVYGISVLTRPKP